jgi:hypothetical protein
MQLLRPHCVLPGLHLFVVTVGDMRTPAIYVQGVSVNYCQFGLNDTR